MSQKISFSLLMATAACSAQASDPPDVQGTPDAGQTARYDAQNQPPPPPPGSDAAVDAGVPPGDGCAQQVTQLLKNATFDQAPLSTQWSQTRIDPYEPLVVDDPTIGVPAHTPPARAWLGGIEAGLSIEVTDALVQNVTIPTTTTALTLTGMYDVRTSEAPTTIAYDTAALVITELDGTPIVTVLSASNLTPKTTWTMFGHAFTQNLAGKTVRVRITSTNDFSDPTSFFFDSLALTATHGCSGPT